MYIIQKRVGDIVGYYTIWNNMIKEPIFLLEKSICKKYKYLGTAMNIKKRIDEHYSKYTSKLAQCKENDCEVVEI